MRTYNEAIWGIPVTLIGYCIYKVSSNALRHPDAPYFFRGLRQFGIISFQRLTDAVRTGREMLPTHLPPLLSDSTVKGLVGVVILLICAAIGSWPYNFYVLLRIVVTGMMIAAFVRLHKRNQTFWSVTTGFVAITFNPIAPFHFSKDAWRLLNICAAVVTALLIGVSRISQQEELGSTSIGGKVNCPECERLDSLFISIRAGRTIAAMDGRPTKKFDDEESELLSAIISHKTAHTYDGRGGSYDHL